MFYTEDSRPFREVCQESRRIMFKSVERFEPGKVYTEGCLKQLIRLMNRASVSDSESPRYHINVDSGNVLYIGDSLFADLVDAKVRIWSWA